MKNRDADDAAQYYFSGKFPSDPDARHIGRMMDELEREKLEMMHREMLQEAAEKMHPWITTSSPPRWIRSASVRLAQIRNKPNHVIADTVRVPDTLREMVEGEKDA